MHLVSHYTFFVFICIAANVCSENAAYTGSTKCQQMKASPPAKQMVQQWLMVDLVRYSFDILKRMNHPCP